MTLRIILTDGDKVQGLSGVFGAYITSANASTAADVVAANAAAGQAAASALAASNSAGQSAGSAANSLSSANLAMAWASQVSGFVNGTTSNSSFFYAQQSAASATTAGTQATNSANSAILAGNSATTAGTQATNAATSAGNSSASATLAQNWATQLVTKVSGIDFSAKFYANQSAASAAAAAASAASITLPVPIASGGTGQSTIAGAVAALGLNTLSGRNRINNGDCRVVQRSSGVASTGVAGYGGPDRFFFNNNASAGGQFTQSAGTIIIGGVTKPAVVQTVNTPVASLTGTNSWQGIGQKIEGFNCYDMVGQAASASFIFNTNVTGLFSICLTDSTGTQSYIATFNATANTPVKVAIPIAALPLALVVPNNNGIGLVVRVGALNQGTLATATLNAWVSGNFSTTASVTNWGATAGNFIAMTELQLEVVTVTQFERENIADTIVKCQRFYQVLQLLTGVNGNAGSLVQQPVLYPVPMRAIPTIGGSAPTFSNCSAASLAFPGTNGSTLQFTVTASGSAQLNWSPQLSADL